ncbi:MAG: AMP-dependent synthetase [Verrucomicrobia bacterium]|nr:MAG: AMP-dependent synthetase [Verrucomicrobiota bacterium]
MPETIPALLRRRANASAAQPALGDIDSARLDYARLHGDVTTAAAALRSLGVAPEDRVAMVLPNGPDAALAFLGVSSCATAAPLNPGYSEEEFAFYLKDLEARLVIVDADAAPAAVRAAASLGIPTTPWPLPANTGTPAAPELPSPEDVALVLHTSGTTSRPKIVPLSHANLTASAANIAAALRLTEDDVALNVMPLFHIHGLVASVLATLHSGGTVICTPGFDGTRILDWLSSHPITWYTAVPTMHQAVLQALQSCETPPAIARLRFVRSCSSALPPRLMADLEAALGVPVIEAYGMTEAAHQMACNPLPPGPRKPGSVGVPTGVEIAIVDDDGAFLPPGETGEVVIRGPNVTRGYARPAEANATAFIDGWFRTGDEGRFDADGYLFLTGRLKEMINRGGEKIAPREIDEALLEHPDIAQAVAFAVPHPSLGEDVAVAVVPRQGATLTPEEVRAYAFRRLADFKVPSIAIIVDAIPKGPTGKLQRIGLAEKLEAFLKSRYEPPADLVETLLSDAWLEVLEVERVGAHDNFFALGGDSLRGNRVIAQINEIFDVDLRVPALFRAPTLREFAAVIRERCSLERLAEIEASLGELDDPPSGPAPLE